VSDPRHRAEAQARRDLDRVAREGETLGGTAMDAASRGLAKDDEDGVERLGRRIGRGLAVVAAPVALWWFGRSAGWW